MNLVLLIGNGFDIKQGLKTRYTDFYDWYKERNASGILAVDLFRNQIASNQSAWSDLEKRLGEYLEEVASKEDAKAIFNDVLRNLRQYILNEYDRFDFPDQSEDVDFMRHFFDPSLTFRPRSKRLIGQKLNFAGNEIHLKIIVFNYTNTLEDLLGWKEKQMKFMISGIPKYIDEIEHIHGYADHRGRMALGVNHPDQIKNPVLAEAQDVVMRYVKPAYNDTYEEEHDAKCMEWIDNAHAIMVYGMSFGDTDQRWWEAIGRRLSVSSSHLLFVNRFRNISLEGNSGPEYQEAVLEDKEFIGGKLGNASLENQIYVTYSREIFDTGKNFEKPAFLPDALTFKPEGKRSLKESQLLSHVERRLQ